MTLQTQHRVTILIRSMIVITDASNVKRSAIEKGSNKIMRTFDGKVSDDSV